ncbi:MAG: hypothetical protein H0W90_11040 [Actinobacteria bacterium]|nr:hypothetical protein [Actinomycetota bacterium]
MTRFRAVVAPLLALVAALASAGTASSAATNVRVSTQPASVATSIGQKFAVRVTVTNKGSAPTRGLIAHLNVLSLDGSVYVDPEDWSSNRTRYLDPIAAGDFRTLAWKLQAVNSGSIGVYIAVLPRSGEPRLPVTGPTVHVAIARRQTLNSGGILPLVLGIPALLAALGVALRIGLRRQSG